MLPKKILKVERLKVSGIAFQSKFTVQFSHCPYNDYDYFFIQIVDNYSLIYNLNLDGSTVTTKQNTKVTLLLKVHELQRKSI